MHPLNPYQLDVRGGRWARNEGDGSPVAKDRITQACDGLWNKVHDLVFIHDTEMIVGEQRDDATALLGTAVQHDGTGLGDPKCTTCEHTIAGIKLFVGERAVILQLLDPGR